jgi:hypothetical protein
MSKWALLLSLSPCFSFHKSRDIAGIGTAENSKKQDGKVDGKVTAQSFIVMDWKAAGGTNHPQASSG